MIYTIASVFIFLWLLERHAAGSPVLRQPLRRRD